MRPTTRTLAALAAAGITTGLASILAAATPAASPADAARTPTFARESAKEIPGPYVFASTDRPADAPAPAKAAGAESLPDVHISSTYCDEQHCTAHAWGGVMPYSFTWGGATETPNNGWTTSSEATPDCTGPGQVTVYVTVVDYNGGRDTTGMIAYCP